MKKIRIFFSFVLIFSIATFSPILFTNDITIAQAANTIQIKDKSLILEVDHYKTLRLSGTTKRASWSTSNNRVASVTSNGKVFAKAPGTATITAFVGGKKLTCKVTVIYLNKKTITMKPGKSSTLTVNGTKSKVSWHSSDESIATVSSSGKITSIAPGTATISASVEDRLLNCKLTVVDINHDAFVLELGGWSGYIKTLKIKGTTSKITWSSSNKAIATVSNIGKVTAKGAGSATITASVDGIKLTSKVKVLKMSTKEFTLEKGDTKTLKIYGTTSKVTWYSNDDSVATVSSNGKVTGKAVGSATIIGVVDGSEVESEVTILE